jgi:hypothetical protein
MNLFKRKKDTYWVRFFTTSSTDKFTVPYDMWVIGSQYATPTTEQLKTIQEMPTIEDKRQFTFENVQIDDEVCIIVEASSNGEAFMLARGYFQDMYQGECEIRKRSPNPRELYGYQDRITNFEALSTWL